MRFFCFLAILLLTSGAQANQPISGSVEVGSAGYHLVPDQGSECKSLSVETNSSDTARALNKLSQGDYINATGFLKTESCQAILESIEYVGLKKLLGYWYSAEGLVSVRDFTNLSFFPISRKIFHDIFLFPTASPIEYRYSVTLSEGAEWVVFLSDKQSTTFATLQFDKGHALITVYDSETGKITKSLRLSRWSPVRQ